MAESTKDGAVDDYQKLAAEQAVATERLVQQLAIPACARVLDIGCGTGHAALAAARRNARVIGVDINEHSLARARVRADAEGLTDIDFQVANATALPFEDGSFDVVLSTLALVFLPDQEAAARELARVVRPGGVVALTAYTAQSIASQIYDLLNGHFNQPNLPPRPHYSWSHGPRVGALLAPYFDAITVRYEAFDTCAASPAAWFDHVARWNPNIRKGLANASEAVAQQAREGCIRILDPFNRATDGTFLANMDYAVITAVRRR